MIYALVIIGIILLVQFVIICHLCKRVEALDEQVHYFRGLWKERELEIQQMLKDGAIDFNKVRPITEEERELGFYWGKGK